MPKFVKLTTQAELPIANEAKEFPCGGNTVCIANVDGEYSAMDNVCLHRGGPLSQGTIANGTLICPWHAWAWNIKTGEATHDLRTKIAVYPLKIEDGDVLVEI